MPLSRDPEHLVTRRLMTRRDLLLRALALGVATPGVASLLAACGGPAPSPTSAPKPAAPAGAPAPTTAPGAQPAAAAKPTAAPAAPTAAPAAAAKPAAASAGKITLAQGFEPRSLWGNSSTTQQEINVSEQVTEKLIEFTADATDFEPRLATEWKQLDPKTWQFKLREGVKFSNGEEFNAESAKLSLDVMLKSSAYAAFTDQIAGAEVAGKYAVNVTTKDPTLLHLLAIAMGSFQYPAAYFKQVGEEQFGRKPIGTGPYLFGEWVKDSHVTLEANPGYWGGAPPIKTVVFRNIVEGAAKLAALETGEVDFIIDTPLDAVERLERNPNVQLISRPSNRMFYLMLSTLTDTPLKNAKVRQALQYSVDVDALIKGLFKGRASKLEGQVISPSYFGHYADLKAKPYDPEKTKQLLAEAGFPNGIEFTFKYSAGRYVQDKEAGQAISAQMLKANVRVKQEVLEPGTFLTQLTTLKLNDMALVGNLPPPDFHYMYRQFVTGFLYSYYSNPAWDDLIKKGAATSNKDERLKIYRQVMDLVQTEWPFIPLYYPHDIYAASKKVSGFAPRASQFLDMRAFKLG